MRAVCPLYVSRAFTSASRSSSNRTAPAFPARAAVISTVSPLSVVSVLGSAPALRRAPTVAAAWPIAGLTIESRTASHARLGRRQHCLVIRSLASPAQRGRKKCPSSEAKPLRWRRSLYGGGAASLEFRQRARAVADAVLRNAGLVENGQQQVRHRCVFGVLEMTSAFQCAKRSARDENRKRGMIVNVAVAHRAAVE